MNLLRKNAGWLLSVSHLLTLWLFNFKNNAKFTVKTRQDKTRQNLFLVGEKYNTNRILILIARLSQQPATYRYTGPPTS